MRGISPELLIAQVRNTAPYLFDDATDPAVLDSPAVRVLREHAREPPASLTHAEYFRLCLCAHYATCGTPVSTDVDNQIRKKLWAPGLPLATALDMAELVLASHAWDFRPLTNRSSCGAAGSAWESSVLHGHHGEWFTVAVAAYAALGPYRAAAAKALRESILTAIGEETARHAEVFGSLWRANDGIGALLASASIAHNFGDLDRVVAMWEVPVTDPLHRHFHRLTTSAFGPEGELRYLGRLWTAGQLYKASIDGSSIALENHRHFALRKPRALRTRPELRVELGPFLDAWGTRIGATLDGEPLEETIDALVHGCARLPGTLGYARALRGIAEARPELAARFASLRREPRLKATLATSREAFEARWHDEALRHLDDIPSRARP